jgi:DNA-binding CsgD family transcriptional regulator
MFVEQLRRAVEVSPRVELAKVSGLLWKAYAAGHVTEAEASALSEAIELKRALPAAQKPVQRRLGSRPRSPAAMERRRRWAASGALPPALASRFTLAEQAVLAVVATEHRKRGDCQITNKEVADVAGVSITTVKNALRGARALNLLTIEERRLTAFRNAPNIVRITDPSWRAWLRLGGGGKSVPRSPTQLKISASAQLNRPWAAEGQGPRRDAPRREASRATNLGHCNSTKGIQPVQPFRGRG